MKKKRYDWLLVKFSKIEDKYIILGIYQTNPCLYPDSLIESTGRKILRAGGVTREDLNSYEAWRVDQNIGQDFSLDAKGYYKKFVSHIHMGYPVWEYTIR